MGVFAGVFAQVLLCSMHYLLLMTRSAFRARSEFLPTAGCLASIQSARSTKCIGNKSREE
jgi:hypothetical protein